VEEIVRRLRQTYGDDLIATVTGVGYTIGADPSR
jgi:hypothetical protein